MARMGKAILVSGATGFLGTAIVWELLSTTDAKIYVPVRGKEGRAPSQRLESLWIQSPLLRDALGVRVWPVEADIECDLLGMEVARYNELAQVVDTVIHAAAEVGVNQPAERFWSVNVRGTHGMLEFARHAARMGGINRYVQVSTAYVAGRLDGHRRGYGGAHSHAWGQLRTLLLA